MKYFCAVLKVINLLFANGSYISSSSPFENGLRVSVLRCNNKPCVSSSALARQIGGNRRSVGKKEDIAIKVSDFVELRTKSSLLS